MIFATNQLIKTSMVDDIIERILWIDENYKYCFTIDIYKTAALPELKNIDALQELLDEGNLEVIPDDPFTIYFNEEELTASEIRIRNNRWETIKEIVVVEPDIYESGGIAKVVRNVYEDKKISKRAIYANLRLYWQKGLIKNSLLPNYKDCGGYNTPKNLGEKKIGRPKKYLENQPGINVTEDVKLEFYKGVKRYKTPKTNLEYVYKLILRDAFVEDTAYVNGRIDYTYKVKRPTYRQFLYWYRKNYDSQKRNIAKKGVRKHLLSDRSVLGSSDRDINSPGAKFQIDSTVGNIYLVSEKDRDLVVGRPTVYFVSDVFSRMIVGMYIGLEEASWLAATMALVNTVKDKVEFCRLYGITIEHNEWPSNHLPESILADRAEFKGYKPEQLINAFGVRVENTPSYRADFKGIIEQNFNLIDQQSKPFLPGGVPKEGLKRGERDYRLDASLTLKEYTKIIIHLVLYNNNKKWLSHYKPSESMFADGINMIPVDIWNWGIKNRSGKLKRFSDDSVKMKLLPRGKAKVTGYGLRFNRGNYYSCDKAEAEKWFEQARIEGTWNLNVAYDPGLLQTFIY